MTDNAEMGERPADPATRGGVGVGAGPDDYAEGMAEQQAAALGAADPGGADAGAQPEGPPGEAQTPLAETDALAYRMQPVDDWGTGDADQPQESPRQELENDT